MHVIEGTIEDIIFKSEETGYCVLSVYTEADEVTLVGTMYNVAVGEEIRATGSYTAHQIYGEQFKVEQYQTFIPRDVRSMERYLGSGAIKGIGPALSKRIVDTFGDETFSVIETDPERLADLKGISQKKAQEIALIFEEQRKMRQVIIFLQEYGISLTYALKIYKEYEEHTIPIIRKNPYRLAEEIDGIGFEKADELATRIGFDPQSINRVKAALTYVLYKGTTDGHVYLERHVLVSAAEQLLRTEGLDTENALMELQIEQKVMIDYVGHSEMVYLIRYYDMEQYVANKLFDLASMPFQKDEAMESEIHKIEKRQQIELDDVQREAIVEAMSYGVFILTGGPGTGKTTTINAIIQAFVDKGMEVLLAAPTGRAAKRMTETTGYPSKTIHRLLEITMGADNNQNFERNEEYPLEADVIIIDEASMVDITLMYYLMKAIVPGTRLIFVGDQDQLPSVGPGNVLKDMIHSGVLNTIKLERIFRQAAESDIVVNAHMINKGEGIRLKEKRDFFFVSRQQAGQGVQEIINLIQNRLPGFINKYLSKEQLEAAQDISDHIQVLTPMRKGITGVNNLNEVLQQALNPASSDKKEKVYRNIVFREQDKVMQIKNNYNAQWQVLNKLGYQIEEGSGIFNGDIGRIIDVNHFTETLKVRFDDGKIVIYEFTNLDELELAYAITIHKSQGSEYPVIILPVFMGPPMLMTRNLLYTAITRAKSFVVLVGQEGVIRQMIDNNREVHRNSFLSERLLQVFSIHSI